MTHDQQKPQMQDFDPSFQEEVSSQREIDILTRNPAIDSEDLFSSNKMQSAEYPDRPGVRVLLDAPILTARSERSDVHQDLMAVIALGNDVALGVVKGRDKSGSEVSYLSLLHNDPYHNDARAQPIGVLADGIPVTIGRSELEQAAPRGRAVPGVSRTHCTVELRDDILTVVDEASTNGTRVFTNKTGDEVQPFMHVQEWSQPSVETKKLIEASKHAIELSKALKLGSMACW